jgi:hypothetical protein
VQEGEPERGGEKCRERAILGSLNPDRVNSAGFGIAAHLVQKDGFAYPSEADRATQPKPLQADFDVLANLSPASEFRRWAAGSRGIGIPNRVHSYSEFSRLMMIR